MNYILPKTVEVCSVEYNIRSDYRAVLDIFDVLSSIDLNEQEKGIAILDIFYPDFITMPDAHLQEAIRQCFLFINCGIPDDKKKALKLFEWEQDLPYILAPINRVMGVDVRSVDYMHWWTFMSAYLEIGDCLFAQIVRIRSLKVKGKSLDKTDQEFYRQNRQIIDLKTKYSSEEDELLKQWGAG